MLKAELESSVCAIRDDVIKINPHIGMIPEDAPKGKKKEIRKLHKMIGHKPKEVMVQILRGARQPPDVIK